MSIAKVAMEFNKARIAKKITTIMKLVDDLADDSGITLSQSSQIHGINVQLSALKKAFMR